jgi:DNA-directed RNA polymerase subunit alpha
MTIDLTGLVRPHVVEMTKREDLPFGAEFRLQPLERGFGHTLGNAMRRMLLSSLRGSAVWAFRLEGVVHEHQTVPGVVEDIHQIIQRLKSLTVVLAEDVEEAVLHLEASQAGPVMAQDIEKHGAVQIVHPEQVLFTLQEDREISGELYVNKGRGYVEASLHQSDRSMPVDLVKIDAMYSPVLRANFTVAETRVGQRTDFDSVTLSVETNGAISPEDGVAYAAALLQEHLRHFIDFGRVPSVPDGGEGDSTDSAQMRDLLAKPIDDCGLSVRSINSLKNSSISTLGDLVRYSEDDMLKVKNVGEKALKEIAEMLQHEGLAFGMSLEDGEAEMAAATPNPIMSAEPTEGKEGQ